MVKSFQSHSRAQEDFSELYENSLFTTPQERALLVANKSRVAHAFLLNFYGMLGMINATKPAQKRALLTFLKTDKKLRIDTIDDTNHDISLSLKLAHEAGFFMQATTVAEITRFLVKLKAGQIDHVDSAVVGKWAAGMKPDFLIYIQDPAARRIFNQFRMDGGATIDVSSLAVVLKSRVNKMADGGDFQGFAKRFIGLTAISPTATTPVAAAPVTTNAQPAAAPAPTAPVKLSYYQRQKLKKQQAAAGTTATPTPAAAAPAPKLSYYQKQKLKRDADQAIINAIAAAEKAAADLKAKEEEENRKAAAASVKSMPREHFDKMVEATVRPGFGLSGYAITPYNLKLLFKFDVVPDLYVKVAELLTQAVSNLENIRSNHRKDSGQTFFDEQVKEFNQKAKELEKVSGYLLTIPDFVKAHGIKLQMGIAGLAYAAIRAGATVDNAFFTSTIASVANFPIGNFVSFFNPTDPDLAKLAKIIASNNVFIDEMMSFGRPLNTLFTKLTSSWGSNVAPYGYSLEYPRVLSFAIMILKAAPADKSFEYFVNKFEQSDPRALVNIFKGFGMSPSFEVDGIEPADKKYMNEYVKYFLENDFRTGYSDMKRILLRELPSTSMWAGGYSANYPLQKALHDEFATDVISKGYSTSKLRSILSASITEYYMKNIFKFIGVDVDQLVKAHPNDPPSLYIKAVQDGLSSISPKQLAAAIVELPINANGRVSSILYSFNAIAQSAQGDRDQNYNSAARAMLEVAYTRPADFTNKGVGEALMTYLPYANQDTVVKWLKFAKENNNTWIMGSELYKSIHKSKKQDYVDILTGIVQDSIGTEVEDYVNDIMEGLAPHVIQKMRGNLVGANAVIGELNKGEIKPFDKIDATRLKKIFLYNDLNMGSIVSGQVEKKKKTESYAQYFARASKAIQSTSLLGEAKVKPDAKADAKAINKIMIQRDHAGKHGDTYPKIDKVYDANLEYPEFWEFRKRKPQDGSIVPAYHGTGGIAASMILRYGFKVIKSSDPSVVGRMLGDGIYFSNKIDKVSQYVSNGGYSRQHGQKGYVMEMDTNLGKEYTDYRAAGVKGSDGIRSPEWCVVDPKAQLRVTRVYEVTLVSKSTVDKHLNEGVQYTSLKGFKQHLKEEVVQDLGNFTSFVFRDGMIPIVDYETSAVSYVDFEEALSKKLINEDMFDVSAQGPVIVFRSTPDQVVVDERFASHMAGDELQLYIELFKRNMAPV